MKEIVFDIETNGLKPDRIWCIVAKPLGEAVVSFGPDKIKEGLEFFEAHKAADVYHRKACEKLLDGLSKKDQKKAEKAALSTAKYLWNFLSGMVEKHSLQVAA